MIWRSPTVLVFVVAAAARTGWVLFGWSATGGALTYPDERLHWQLACNLVERGSLISDDGRLLSRMPLYPLFLAPFAAFGETGILLARIAQALLGAAGAAMATRLAGVAVGRRAAWLAGGLVAVDPYNVFFAALLLTEVPFTFLSIWLISASWKLATRNDAGTGAARCEWAVALLGTAAIFVRPSAAGWVALLWLGLVIADRDRWRCIARMVRYGWVLLVFLAPWGLRNMVAVGDFAWLSANGGVTLFDAQGPQADGRSDQAFLTEMNYLDGLSEPERDGLLGRWAQQAMKEDWRRVGRLAMTKLARTWNPIPNEESHSRGATALISAAYTIVVVALALAGLWRSIGGASPGADLRPMQHLQRLVWLPVIYFTLLHCVYIGSVRYRVPLMPVLAIGAAGVLFRADARRD